MNSAPPWGWLRASMVPPCWTTIFWTTARPRPVPLALCGVEGHENLGDCFCGIPGPLSEIGDSLALHGRRRLDFSADDYAAADLLPPTASAALRARFRIACRSKGSSPETVGEFSLGRDLQLREGLRTSAITLLDHGANATCSSAQFAEAGQISEIR